MTDALSSRYGAMAAAATGTWGSAPWSKLRAPPAICQPVLLTPKRVIPFSLHQLVSAGIYPERQRILVVKGTVAPRAAYEPVRRALSRSIVGRLTGGQSEEI